MADVQLVCRNFPAPLAQINGQRILDVTKRRFMRAVLTVGLQRFGDVVKLGWPGVLHRLGICFSVLAFLERRQEGLCLARSHEELESSEKAGLSFWYGMAMAKIVADSELDIPWLAHVDHLRARGILTTTSTSKEKGDMAGVSRTGDWHVVEAKGRTGSYSTQLVKKAKRQASRITAINGTLPKSTSACITSMHTRPVSVLLDDPPSTVAGGDVGWSIPDDDFFRQYYRGLIDYIESFPPFTQRIGGGVFRTAPLMFPMLHEIRFLPFFWQDGLQIGLNERIFETPEAALGILQGADDQVSVMRPSEQSYVGSDGIALIGQMPDWEVAGDGAT